MSQYTNSNPYSESPLSASSLSSSSQSSSSYVSSGGVNTSPYKDSPLSAAALSSSSLSSTSSSSYPSSTYSSSTYPSTAALMDSDARQRVENMNRSAPILGADPLLVEATNRSVLSSDPMNKNQTIVTETVQTTQPIRPVQPVAPAVVNVPAHPIVTPVVPEGTTILNYPGAPAVGPTVPHPQQLPVGPTSGVQQGSTHDRYMKSSNPHLPQTGKDGSIQNYHTMEDHQAAAKYDGGMLSKNKNKDERAENEANIPAADRNAAYNNYNPTASVPIGPNTHVVSSLYPTMSAAGNTPVVQQATYPTAVVTNNVPESNLADGNTAIGMYGSRPGATGTVNEYGSNRAAFDNGNYNRAANNTKTDAYDNANRRNSTDNNTRRNSTDSKSHAANTHVPDTSRSGVVPGAYNSLADANTTRSAYGAGTTGNTGNTYNSTTGAAYPTNATDAYRSSVTTTNTTTNTTPGGYPATGTGELYNKDRIEPEYQKRDVPTL